MLRPKEVIVEQLRARGDMAGVPRELGEKVGTERDAELLAQLQIDPAAGRPVRWPVAGGRPEPANGRDRPHASATRPRGRGGAVRPEKGVAA